MFIFFCSYGTPVKVQDQFLMHVLISKKVKVSIITVMPRRSKKKKKEIILLMCLI